MLKKYFSTFFGKTKNKRATTPSFKWGISLFPIKKKQKKYQKRKKNIFQNTFKKVNIFWNNSIKSTWLVVWLILLPVSIFFLFFSSYTSISQINIYREGPLIDINRAYTLLDYLRGKNLINTDNASIVQRLQKSQTSISQIRINKDFPNTLNIYLDSYSTIFQTENHYILTNGSIIQKENEDFPETRLLYLSTDVSEYVDFWQKLNTTELSQINLLLEELSKNILWFNSAQIFYYIKEREVLIKDSLWIIYIFDLEQNINQQVRRLAIYDTESNSSNRELYSYIDLRISDKIFLCSRDLQATCENNLRQIYSDLIFQIPLPETSESPQ